MPPQIRAWAGEAGVLTRLHFGPRLVPRTRGPAGHCPAERSENQEGPSAETLGRPAVQQALAGAQARGGGRVWSFWFSGTRGWVTGVHEQRALAGTWSHRFLLSAGWADEQCGTKSPASTHTQGWNAGTGSGGGGAGPRMSPGHVLGPPTL